MYSFFKYLFKIFFLFVFRIKVTGRENAVCDRSVIFACNHKSNWDPLVILATCPTRLAFMAKAELFKFRPLAYLLKKFGAFPVNRGKNDISAIKTSLKILSDGKAFAMFPEGKRVKEYIREDVKSGIAMLATRAKVPIMPITISGKYRWLSKIEVIYHEPFYLDEYFEEKLSASELHEISMELMDKIYSVDKTKV